MLEVPKLPNQTKTEPDTHKNNYLASTACTSTAKATIKRKDNTAMLEIELDNVKYGIAKYSSGCCYRLYQFKRKRDGESAWIALECYPHNLGHALSCILDQATMSAVASEEISDIQAAIKKLDGFTAKLEAIR